VRLVDRYLPDPYLFVLILTLIIIAAAMAIEGHGPIAVIRMWGDGFWDLLAFSMQDAARARYRFHAGEHATRETRPRGFFGR
jgi:short subunit fatty acids transporter